VTTPETTERGLVGRIAGNYPLAATYHLSALRSNMVEITPQVSQLVTEATGLPLPGLPQTEVVGRAEWVQRNVAVFNALIEPARRQLEERIGEDSAGANWAKRALEFESSALLAFLSRKVLGQYELVLPGGDPGDVVAYVGANILEMERRNHFKPSEFRFWVALHELTHRAQFQGVPWMRDYFLGLVAELVEQSTPEPGRLARVVEEIESRRASGDSVIDERGVFGLLGTPGQQEVVDRIQALMSLLEGHGHVIMDRLGAQHLRGQERMSKVLKDRRMDKRTQFLFRLTGLEMKMKQYRLGEQFVLGVEKEGGWESVSVAFHSAQNLPTLEEIETPGKWLTRVA
jgi:coenzyme F420 biosynthesis associated uncharacterized protein